MNINPTVSVRWPILVFEVMRRSIRLLSHGKLPAVPDCHEAQHNTDNATYSGNRGGPGENAVTYDDHRRTRERGNCVEFGGKDNRDFRDKHVARHASADSSQDTH